MKNFLTVVGALVLGLVVGSWQPRGEVLRLRGKLDEMAERQRRCNRSSTAEGIQQLLRGAPPGASEERRPNRRPPPAEAPPAEADAPEVAEAAPVDGAADPLAEAKSPEAIRDALNVRAAQARAALLERAELSDAQLAEVDRVVAEMNRRLKGEVDQVIGDIEGGADLGRRDVMDLAAESLDAVIAADDGIRAAIGDEAYAELDPEVTDPLSFISGDTMERVVQLSASEGAD